MKIDSDAWRKTLVTGARDLGVTVTDEQVRCMARHARELLAWNRVTNLTAITDPQAVAVKHYVDSLAVVPMIGSGLTVLDAGAGGGFPGLPLKIVRPDLTLTLVDSVRKKVSFLSYAIGVLGLSGVRAVHGRLEDLAWRPMLHKQQDLVICRAFSSLEQFVALTLPLLSPGGSLVALKGPRRENDADLDTGDDGGTAVLSGTRFLYRIHRYCLPLLGDRRRLIWLTPMETAGCAVVQDRLPVP